MTNVKITQSTIRDNFTKYPYLTYAEAATLTGVSQRSIRRLVKQGVARGYKSPSPYTVDHAGLIKHFKSG